MKLLSIKDIIEKFGQGYWFWYELVKEGKIPYFQKSTNGKILIDEDDVSTFLSRSKVRKIQPLKKTKKGKRTILDIFEINENFYKYIASINGSIYRKRGLVINKLDENLRQFFCAKDQSVCTEECIMESFKLFNTPRIVDIGGEKLVDKNSFISWIDYIIFNSKN